MSTSEAQVIARALYDSLFRSTVDALRAVSTQVQNGKKNGLDAALPETTPREVKNLVLALEREGRLDQLPAVIRAFENYTEGGEARLEGEITSAVELDGAQRERIITQLRQQYGQALDLTFSVDPSLIGGLIIRVGDQVLDNSLRARLSAVQRNMVAS